MGTGRIYVNFGKDYNNYSDFNNFEDLVNVVALSVRYANGKPLVMAVGEKQVIYASRTKKYIAQEATRFISRIGRIYNGDHMALHVSKRQINRLIRVCEHKGNHLSCYSFIVLHIIYTSIKSTEVDKVCVDLNALSNLIYSLANEYLLHNHNDLVQYIVDCHRLMEHEIKGKQIYESSDFPQIHRWF